MEELDLTDKKWALDEDAHISIILDSLTENFPGANIQEEMKEIELTAVDLTYPDRLLLLLNRLNEKFPE